MTSSELTALRARCWSGTTHEITGRLVLADWLAEHGHERESLEMRIVAEPEREKHYRELAAWYRSRDERVTCPDTRCKNGRGNFWKGVGLGKYDNDMVCLTCEGTGTIPDPANAARAEFIEVQMALVKLEERAKKEFLVLPESTFGQHLDAVRRYERELRTTHEARWRRAGVCPKCGGSGDVLVEADGTGRRVWIRCDQCPLNRKFTYRPYPDAAYHYPHEVKQEPVRLRWHNGTIAGVECAWEDVVGQKDSPDKTVRWHVPTPWARAVLTHHPTVRQFVVSGREPLRVKPEPNAENPYCWRFTDDWTIDPHLLPPFISPFVTACDDGRETGIPMVWYATTKDALVALHTAVADWVRWSVEKGDEK